MSKFKDLTLIPVHTHPLSLDSGNSVRNFIRSAAIDFNKPAIALTDHGTIGAILEANDVAKELKKEGHDIKIIPGIELYLMPDEASFDGKSKYYHVTVHFDDFETYLKACKLSKTSFDRAIWAGGELKPLTTWEELESLSGKVTLFSSCLVGVVSRPLINGNKEVSERNFLRLMRLAGPGRFFAEIFPYEVSKNWNRKTKTFDPIPPTECCPSGALQRDANEWIMYLAKKYDVPALLSEDAHYAKEEDKIIQDLRINKDGADNWKMSDANCLHSTEWLYNEMKRIHPGVTDSDFEKMIINSHIMAENFKGFDSKFKHSLPIPEVDGKKLNDSEITGLVISLIQKEGRIDLNNEEYVSRLNHEIEQLAFNGKINVLPYFLPLIKIVKFCNENNILLGPGRGSAAGSLLNYALGITSVDPIKEDLSFERFFDVTRVEEGLADIDTDFSDRDSVIKYIFEEWGDNVAYLGTGITFKIKSALKDIDRILHGQVRRETELICATIPTSPQGIQEDKFLRGYVDADGVYHEGELETNEKLAEYLNNNPKAAEIVFKMVGMIRQSSRHASGLLIAGEPVQNFIPVMKISDEITTQILPKYVEKCGGVKYDILGVSTLKDIQGALKLIKERHGKEINPWTVPDSKVIWESVAKDASTIFQLHTSTVKKGLQLMRPKTVQEAAILTSVFRPGAMDAPAEDNSGRMMSDVFLDRWIGKEPVRYIHPDLEEYLKSTVGIFTYQEQLMRIVNELGGLTMPETNQLRKAISKKTGDALIKLLLKVEENLIKFRNWTPEQARQLVEQMKTAGKYIFNKSHACLAYDQKILTDGGYIAIGDLVENRKKERVKFLSKNGTIESEYPLNYFDQGSKEVFEVLLDDGSTISATLDHKFFVNNKWITLEEVIGMGYVETYN